MLPDDLRELAKKTAKSIIDHGSIPMATLKESIILQEKVDTLLAKEIEFPEVEPYPEIPEVDLTPVIDKLEEILTESKKKDLLEYDLQIDEKARKKLKGDKGDVGPSGKDGINGIDGIDGINGIDGKDGVEISPEEVVSKLESLKGEKRLSVKAIKGLDEIIQNIRETRVVNGGVRTLANLYDVTLSVPTNGQALVYNATLQKWENGTISGNGITLKTNGSTNATQSILDLKQGTNVTIVDDGLGGITINSTASGGGSGDVVGPASAVNNNFVAFDTTTGKLIKDSGSNASSFATSAQGTLAGTALQPSDIGVSVLAQRTFGTAANNNTGDFATATQGTKADNAVVANGAITGGTKTKITYDTKGLVTAGADATTADIADSLNKRYVTDANLTTIGNQSGTNTGDVTLAGTPNYITIAGQVITRALIDLTTHVTGLLPFANIANVATSTVMYRKTAGAGSMEAQTLATLKTDLGLTGTNSGDQTSIVGITGTIAQFNTAITDGDLATGGGTATGTNTGDNAVNTLYSGLATSKQDTLTLTTTGTSGAATLVGATLNIPQYSGGGGGGTTITTQDEGSTLSTTVTTLNFTGAGVTASGSGATTTIDIPGGAGGGLTLGLAYASSNGYFMP